MIKIKFFLKNFQTKIIYAPIKLSILEVMHENNIYDAPGTCGGVLLCSTCHIILEYKFYKSINKLYPISYKERILLEDIFNVTSTSRLSCQIITHHKLNEVKIKIPLN